MVFAMAVCHTSGESLMLVTWGLGLFSCGALIISKRADRAAVEVEAPDSDDIVGEGELRIKILEGVAGDTGEELLLMLGVDLVSAWAYVDGDPWTMVWALAAGGKVFGAVWALGRVLLLMLGGDLLVISCAYVAGAP